MADFPALLLWTDAYLADTRHLSTEEHGAYLLLLMEAWRRPSCDLPDDDALLARMAGLPTTRWAEVKLVVMAFWKHDGRRRTWTQKRLRSERERAQKVRQSQKNNAAKRWNGAKSGGAAALPRDSHGTPDAMPPNLNPTPEKKETPSVSPKKRGSTTGTRLADDWQLPEDWRKWAVEQGLDEASVRRQAERFRDYWHGKAGRDAVRLKWELTWRNWIRNSTEDRMRSSGRGGTSLPQQGDERTTQDGRTQRYGGAVDGWLEVRG